MIIKTTGKELDEIISSGDLPNLKCNYCDEQPPAYFFEYRKRYKCTPNDGYINWAACLLHAKTTYLNSMDYARLIVEPIKELLFEARVRR